MVSAVAKAYLKDGTVLDVKYGSQSGRWFNFTIEVEGEEIDFMLNCYPEEDDDKERCWLERDLKADKKYHCDGHYRKSRFDFDRVEVHKVLGA